MEQQSSTSGASQPTFQLYQLKAAKIMLALATLIFFLNYFFVGGGLFYDTAVYLIPYSYTFFIINFLLFMYFFLVSSFAGKMKIFGIILFLCIFVLLGFAMLPIIFKQAILSF